MDFIKNKIKQLTYTYTMEKKTDLDAFWWNERVNLGDSINKDIISKLSNGQAPHHVHHTAGHEHFLVIGSILQYANKYSTVWGSGIISNLARPLFKPKKVCAVRGPKTRKRLLELGISCPPIYGDPALLIPDLFDIPEHVEKEYKLGLIPHYVHKHEPVIKDLVKNGANLIDIETSNLDFFISEILKCEKIISSSLHGVIIADILGVPCRRVYFKNELVGGDFKFHDYYDSVNRQAEEDYFVPENYSLDTLLNLNCDSEIDFKSKDLLEACPFNFAGIKG
jgi:pyruvyltransferase